MYVCADPPGPPSAPEPLEVTSTTCDLAWRPPENDGGSPVTGYYVQRTPAGRDRWIRITRDSVPDIKYKVNFQITFSVGIKYNI